MKPNQVILITGCSSGFGLLSAVHLAKKGYTVYASMRNLEKQQDLLKESSLHNVHISILQLDVTEIDSIKTAVDQIINEQGRLDILVNNAGFGIGGFFEDLSQAEIRNQMDVNFFGVQNVTREVIPHMRRQGYGKIINISSVAGFSTSPCFSAYNASKWALEAFSESLRYEMKLFGIDVYLIEPGTYKTKIFFENAKYAQNFNNSQSPYYQWSQQLKNYIDHYVEQCKKDPQQIPDLIEKIIIGKKKSFRNIPDIESQTLSILRKILPFSIYSRIIEKALRKKIT